MDEEYGGVDLRFRNNLWYVACGDTTHEDLDLGEAIQEVFLALQPD